MQSPQTGYIVLILIKTDQLIWKSLFLLERYSKNQLSSFYYSQFHQRSTSSFYIHRSWKCKKTVKLSVFFALWGLGCPKAACRTLMTLTPSLQSDLCFVVHYLLHSKYLSGKAIEPLAHGWRVLINYSASIFTRFEHYYTYF